MDIYIKNKKTIHGSLWFICKVILGTVFLWNVSCSGWMWWFSPPACVRTFGCWQENPHYVPAAGTLWTLCWTTQNWTSKFSGMWTADFVMYIVIHSIFSFIIFPKLWPNYGWVRNITIPCFVMWRTSQSKEIPSFPPPLARFLSVISLCFVLVRLHPRKS